VALASGSQVAALVLGGLTNLFYARLLAPEELGQLALVLALGALAMVLTELGLHNWATRAIAAGEVRLGDAAALTVKLAPLLSAVVACAGVVVLEAVPALRDALGITASQALLIPEMAVALSIYQAALTLTQGTGAFRARSALLLVNAALTLALTATALLARATVEAAVHATVAAFIVAAVWFIVRTMRGSHLERIDSLLTRRAVREARPLWFNTLLSFATSTGAILVARSVLSLGDVGYYLVINKVVVAGLAPLTALLPMLFARMSAAPDDVERTRRYWWYQQWLTVAFVTGMLLAAPWIVPVMGTLFGERFADRYVALLLLAGAVWLQTTHDLLGYLLVSAKDFAAPLLANGVVVATSLLLVVVLGNLTLSQFAILLVAAHGVGVVVMARTARGRDLRVPALGLATSTCAAGAVLVVSTVLAAAHLVIAVPVSLALSIGVIAGGAAVAPGAWARVRSSLRRPCSAQAP
jgi:O-antigen/teichoic acid export membrane protein